MNRQFGWLATACLLLAGMGYAGPSTATAQDQANGITQPPAVLVIQREFLKPGKSGSVHEKSEQAFVQAMKQANEQTHYIAANSMSGKSRALFFVGYDSFADWGKDMESMMKNPTLAQQFDSAMQADGELLTGYDSGVFTFVPDKSVSPGVNLGQIRYWEIAILKVRLGHDQDWDALAKMHDDIFGKSPDAHWAMFEKRFGSDSGSIYIAISALRSLAELDQHRAAARQAWSQLSDDQKKKMNDLEAVTLESIESNLYSIDPKMSYPRESWRAADPDFWGPK